MGSPRITTGSGVARPPSHLVQVVGVLVHRAILTTLRSGSSRGDETAHPRTVRRRAGCEGHGPRGADRRRGRPRSSRTPARGAAPAVGVAGRDAHTEVAA